MIELRLLLVKSYHVVHVSKGCVQCAELEVISRLTVGEVRVVITHVALILNVDSQYNYLVTFSQIKLTYLKNNKTLLITCTDWLTLSEGAA